MTEVNFILTDVVFAIDFLIRNVKPEECCSAAIDFAGKQAFL
jgi:hypothetical protein